MKAGAHCDAMDGPAVKDGQAALETGNINYAFKWIFSESEEELDQQKSSPSNSSLLRE